MKIDESCVNHIALRLIKEEILAPTNEYDTEHIEELLLSKLTYMKGIIDMADAMKEVIKE